MNKILSLIGLIIVIVALYLYLGFYNISASKPHMKLVEEALEGITENSIEHHTKDIIKPAISEDEVMSEGFEHYNAMCVDCHGSPLESKPELREGLYPKPPLFTKGIDDEVGIEQIYWITKNGIKMTGMPGFGKTHSDEKIWAIAAFVEKLPNMSESTYRELELKNKRSHHDEGMEQENTGNTEGMKKADDTQGQSGNMEHQH